MDGDNRSKQPAEYLINTTVVSILGKVGCLTFFLSGAALLGGLWLDSLLGTRPLVTVVLFALSVPVVTILIVKLTLSGTKHLKSTPSSKSDFKEETTRGNKPEA
jgi:hypothetical protein